MRLLLVLEHQDKCQFPVPSRPHCGGLCVSGMCTHLETDSHDHIMAQGRSKRITHFHGSGALCFNAENPILRIAMSVEQDHERLGIAEGVIHELQEQLQRVSAGHQAAHEALQSIHQEMSILRGQMDTRSRIWLVEPKSLMSYRFWNKNGPRWRTWSYLARDFVGMIHAVGDEECRK